MTSSINFQAPILCIGGHLNFLFIFHHWKVKLLSAMPYKFDWTFPIEAKADKFAPYNWRHLLEFFFLHIVHPNEMRMRSLRYSVISRFSAFWFADSVPKKRRRNLSSKSLFSRPKTEGTMEEGMSMNPVPAPKAWLKAHQLIDIMSS